MCQSGAAAVRGYGGQVVVLMRSKQMRVGCSSRSNNARDIALDKLFGDPRIFHLIADGDAVPLLNQSRDIAFSRMIGHAAHGNGHAFFFVSGGQCDL